MKKTIVVLAVLFCLALLYAPVKGQIPAAYQVGTWQNFKPAAISYTFDDNCSNQIPVAIPMLNNYGFKATIFAITQNLNPNWPNMKTAANAGHEIASHTVTHGNLPDESVATQDSELKNSQSTINTQITNQKCYTVAYPNCNIGDLATIQKYYIAGRTCSGQIIAKSPSDFYSLSSNICGSTGLNTANDMNNKVGNAKSSGGWCVFLIHGIDNDGGYSPLASTILASHLSYVNTNTADYWVGTFGNVVKYIKERNGMSIAETTVNADSLRMTPTDNLDNTIYSVAVTVRRQLPSTWTTARVMQGTTIIASTIVTVSGVKYVQFDVVPDKGVYTLANAAAANPGCATAAPTIISPVSYAQGATATALTATGTALKWYGTNTTGGTASTTAPTPSTTSAGSTTYYVSQTLNSCEGPRAAIVVTVTAGTTTSNAPIGKCKGKYLGNIIPGSVPGNPTNYTTYWNQATSENGSKWGSVESSQGNYNFGTSDVAYNWAKNNGTLFKYHNFVWGSQTPGYISTASTATITAAVENYIKACSTHYASMGGLKMIDVLNEPVNTAMPGNLKAALTAGYQADPANAADKNNQYGWVIWPYQLARKYFPDAVLLINEYNVEMNWNNCRQPYIDMVNAVKNAPNLTDGKKNLIDGVGLQCHGIDNLTAANFKACIDEIWTKTGVAVHITEFDQAANPDEAKQKTVYSTLIPVAWEHPHVAGITLWGYIQGTTWINGNGTAGASGTDSGIMYTNGTMRPAMTWLTTYMASQPSLSCCPAPAPFGACTNGTSPVVNLTAPANSATYAAGANVTLTATATDADGTISKVEFYNGTTLLNTTTASPYTYTWIAVAEGTYTITAVAIDNSGNKTTSTAATITVGNPTTQLINNGEFDGGTTGWTLQNNGGATGTMSGVTNGNLSGTNSLRICPSTTPGTLEWHVQVSQTTPIVSGKTYTISFMAKADAARQMSVAIQELASPYTTYFAQTVDLTTIAQTFTFMYNSTVTDATALIKFYVGADVNCVNIDKISMLEGNFVLSSTITPATATTFCTGGSVVLNANTGTGYTYQWNKDASIISGATAATYTATQSGSYTVSVTANAQTVASTATVVTVNTAPSAPTVTATAAYCQGATATQLTATGTALKWYADNTTTTALANTPIPVTTAAGTTTYFVSQTTNGCESPRAQIAVTVNALPAAAITAGSATTFCSGGSVTLTAGTGSSYVWKNGTTQVGTSATYSATAAGSYTVEVTNANTCKATSAATTVTVNAAPNAPTVTAAASYCQNTTATQLTATGTALKWYADNTTTTALATAPTPATTATGTTTYFVSQTTNGCESPRAQIAVTVNALPTAAITAGSATTFCNGGSVTLTAGTGSSYVWKNGTTQVGTNATYSATTAGSYTVEVTNANSCKATSAATVVTVNTAPAAPTVTATAAYCQNATAAQLTATGTALKWYADNTTTTALATAPTPVTTATGTTTYFVSQTTNGCESPRAQIAVTVNALPTAAITAGSATTFCSGGSVTLTAGTGSSYVWKNGTTQVGTNATYSATAAGSYTVEVTNANSCKATSAATVVTVNTAPAAPTVTATAAYCQNAAAAPLTATGTGLLWYLTANGTGTSTAPTPVTTATGTTTYYVSQTTNGCEGPKAQIAVTVTAAPAATVTAGSATTFCNGGSVTLTASAGTSYVWKNGTTQVGTNATYSATDAGSYTVEVTSGTNCKATSAATVVTINTSGNAPAVTSTAVYCQNATATQLTATGTALKWYADNTTATALAAAPTPSTASAGTTSYFVSQTTSGCESPRAQITVTVNAAPEAIITAGSSTALCTGGSVTLTAGAGASYVWKNGTAPVGTNASYAAATAGSYTVEVTNANNCKATSAATVVTVGTPPAAPIVTATAGYCQNATAVQLTATGTGLKWYADNTTATALAAAPTPSTADAGTTSYFVSQTSGCESPRAQITITVNAAPAAAITPASSTVLQTGGSVVLNANTGSGLTYKWFNNSVQVGTDASYTASAVGSYVVEVSNASGCKATSLAVDVTSAANRPSVITITSPTTDAAITGTITITANITDPDGTIALVEYLDGSTVIGTGTSQPYSFDWTNPTTGNHVITIRVTDSNGGITTSAPVTITSSAISTGVNYAATISATVYPNPSNGDVYVETDMDLSDATFTVINILGEEAVLSASVNTSGARLDVSGLTEGAYILIITEGSSVVRKKITVMK